MAAISWLVDAVISVVLFIQAALYLPQIYRLWRLKDAQAVSIWMLLGGVGIGFFGVLYGHIHEKHLVLIGYALIFMVALITTVLALVYRVKLRLSRKRGEIRVK